MENLFRQEVIDRKKYRLQGVISLAQPPVIKHLTFLIFIIVVISLVFLSLGSYTRKEKVNGVLLPSSGLIKLTSPQSGLVAEILVNEGEAVKQNQPILRVISEKHGAEGVELNQSFINQYTFQLKSLQQKLSQLRIKDKLQIDELNNNRRNIKERQTRLEKQNAIVTERIKLNEETVEQIKSLESKGYISALELKRQSDNLLSLKQQAFSIESEKLVLKNQVEQIDSQLNQLPIEQQNISSQIETQIEDIKLQLVQTKQQRLGELRAPMDGVISGLLVKKGKVVTSNQNVVSLLPENSFMQATIYVPTEAFGFIEKGQLTRIRYHAFPYEKFGIYHGYVSQISENVILPSETEMPELITQPSYRIVVDLDDNNIQAYGKTISLRSGMKLEADIVIEERSLIRWLFDPVFSIAGRM